MSTTDPKKYKELLMVYKSALTLDLIDKKEIIRWADKIIKQDREPDYFIIELSLTGQKNNSEIISLISEFLKEYEPEFPGRMILGLLYHQYIEKSISLKKVVKIINDISNFPIWTDEEINFFYWIDDALYLAKNKISGTIEEVEMETCKFLGKYNNMNIDSLKN